MRKLKGILSAVMAVIMVISGTGFYGTDVTLAAEAESNVVYTDSSAFEFDYGSGSITGYTGRDRNVVIPERIGGVKVEAIADNAFRSSNITSVVIPEGVTSIGSYAFGYCSSLKSATIPGSVKDWYSAFSNCAGLESVEIKEGITNIGGSAFQNCTALTSVTIPEGVTSIGSYAFSGCSLLSSITIPEGVTNIGSYAFGDCGKLTSVTIPGSVEDWDYAFYNCSGLKSAEINKGVTNIGSSAFRNCTALASVIIPEGVTSIGSYAFEDCGELTSVTIPGSVEDWDYAFYNCSGLESVEINKGVTNIGDSAFQNCTSLASATIPEGVTGIGNYAFSGCSLISNITIPEGVTIIGNYAFEDCDALSSVIIPGSVEDWDYAFYNCSGLQSVEIKEGVASIFSNTFYNCMSLISVKIPESVKIIEDHAFDGFSALSNVIIPEGVMYIGQYAFRGCYALESITIPVSVISIGSYAFYNCKELNSVVIGSDYIGISAFAGCIDLGNIEIKEGVKNIYSAAFKNCTALREILLPKKIKSINSTAFEGTNIERVYCYSGGAADNAELYPEGTEIVYLGEDDELDEDVNVAYSFDATTLQAGADKDLLTQIEVDPYFTVVGEITKRTSSATSAVSSVELAKNDGGQFSFTTTAKSSVLSFDFSSTGGSNTSAYAVLDSTGAIVTEGEVTGSANGRTTVTVNDLAPDTYTITSPDRGYNRGGRIYTITVVEGGSLDPSEPEEPTEGTTETPVETTTETAVSGGFYYAPEATAEAGATVFDNGSITIMTEQRMDYKTISYGADTVNGKDYTSYSQSSGTNTSLRTDQVPEAKSYRLAYKITAKADTTVNIDHRVSSGKANFILKDVQITGFTTDGTTPSGTAAVVASLANDGSTSIYDTFTVELKAGETIWVAGQGSNICIYAIYSEGSSAPGEDVTETTTVETTEGTSVETTTEATTAEDTETTTEDVVAPAESSVAITPEYVVNDDGTLTVNYKAVLNNAGFNHYTMFLTFDPAVLTPVSAADGDIALADKDATGADITVSASNAETITAQFTNAPAAGDTDFEGADGVKTQAELGKVKVAYCIFDKDFSQSAEGSLPEFTESGTLFTVTYNINDAAALNGTVLGANVQTLDTVSSDLGVLGTADVLVNEVAVNTSYEPGTEETTVIVEGDTAKYHVTGGYMYININTGEITGCDKTVAGVDIPDEILSGVAVTSMGYGAFNGCSSLTEITIPESITSIGNYAFNNCGLTTVYCYKDSFADNTNLYPPGIEIIYLNYKAEKLFENSPKDVEIKESNDGWNIVKENGAFYAQSTNTDNNSTSSLSVTVEGPGILYYEASVSSEDGGDYLRTNINGRKQAISGSKYTFDAPYVNCIVLQEGENVITWEYDKDGSGSDGQDCAWIKNLRVADIGDSNLDGKVDITDVILGQRYIADNSAITDVLGQKAADYNGDGEVDKKDTAYVLKEIIKNIV